MVENIAYHASCTGKIMYFLQIKPKSLNRDAIFLSFLSSPVLGSAYTRVGLYASTYGNSIKQYFVDFYFIF